MAYGGIFGQKTIVDAFTKDETLTQSVANLFGLGTDYTPNSVFQILAQAALYKTVTPTAQIGTLAVGETIYINENGSPVPYIIVNQGIPQNSNLYDSSCNGTWVMRQDIYQKAVWDAGNSNVLPGADIFSTMAGMLSLYDSDVQSAIKTVKIPYCVGGGSSTVNSGVNGLECQIFPLSCYELGWTTSDGNFNVDGAVLSYFQGAAATDSKRIAYYNSVATTYATRSNRVNSSTYIYGVDNIGAIGNYFASAELGIRPTFILPTTFNAMLSPVSGLYDLSDNLLLKLPGVQIEMGSYTGTGTYGSDNPNSLTFSFEPKLVILLYNRSTSASGTTGVWYTIDHTWLLSVTTSEYMKGLGFYSGNQAVDSYGKKEGNTIMWYNTNNALTQYNSGTDNYYYIAIG